LFENNSERNDHVLRRDVNITTPENVTIRFEAAGIGSRLVALFLDSLIQFGITTVLVIAIILFSIDSFSENGPTIFYNPAVIAFYIIGAFLVYTFYYIFFEMIMKGQTPGKKAAKIRVVSKTGEPINFVMSMVRNLLRLIDMLPGSYVVGIICIIFNKRCQRIGDMIANSMVIKVSSEADFKQRVNYILNTDSEKLVEKEAPTYSLDSVLGTEGNNAYFPVNERQYRNLKLYMERREWFTRKDDYDFFMFRYYKDVTGNKVPHNLTNYYRLCFLTDIVNQNAQYYER
jgi:uncharacterized RDD family membrane protein YckC